MASKFSPATSGLILKILKDNPEATCSEISKGVCKKQGRKFSMLSGTMISAAKEELGIMVRSPKKGRKCSRKTLFKILVTFEGVLSKETRGHLSTLIEALNDAGRANLEIVERINPSITEIRESGRA